jgi:hypothetical protein
MARVVPYRGTRTVPRSRPYRRLASEFTTRLDLLLSAKGLLLHRHQASGCDHALGELHDEIDTLRRRRAYWALQCPGDDSRFWIGAYGRLAELCDRAATSYPGVSDATTLEDAAQLYRRRLQHWRGRDAAGRAVSRRPGS